MKAIVKKAREPGLACVELPEPSPGPGEVKFRVGAAAICGADIHFYHWDAFAENMTAKYGMTYPAVIGHEGAGEVIAVGEGVRDIAVGDRIAVETHIPCGHCYQCQNGMRHNCAHMGLYGFSFPGCFAEFATAPERVCYRLNEQTSFEEGALFEPGGVAMRAVEESGLLPGDTVMVCGCGPIGLVAVQILLACGAAQVIAMDIDDYRLEMAERFGAIPVNSGREDVVGKVKELTSARGGVDAVLEMTGAAEVYDTVFASIRIEGRLVTVGHPLRPVPVDVANMVNMKGLLWKGIFGRRIWETWWKLSGLAASEKIKLTDVATHRYSFEKADDAFRQISKGAGKILFLP